MKKRINSNFILIAALAIILTTVLTTIVYYQVFQKEVFGGLKNYCYVLKETGIDEIRNTTQMEAYTKASSDIRITLIGADGVVRYDSNAKVDVKDNHKNRPEIADAFSTGKGRSIRTSSTINKSNYYYAILLEDGGVLRVAKETGSIVNLFFSVLPIIVLIVLVLLIICMFVGHYLTRSLVKPIEQMASDFDHLEQVQTYKELMPFIDLIRKQHEDILKGAKMRQEFTANVSHELKTPLTSISGYAELIENGMVGDEDIKRFSSEIHRNAKRLITLINDILKLSELDSGSEDDLVIEDINLYEIVTNCMVMLAPVAEKKHITFHLEGEKTIVRGDKDMIDEVIYNLCDNAIRYNHEGGRVWIHVHQGFTVRDDGIGISKENQERIFERFFRVDKSRSKKTGGTGLGLAIVKHIVELHHGKIGLHSELGKGTTITVNL